MTNNKNKHTCKYCKKQGHSIYNCWTLKTKNKIRAERSKTNQQETKIKNNHKKSYICPISSSQELLSDSQKQQQPQEINSQKQEMETEPSLKDTKSNSIFSLIRKNMH